MTTATPPVDQLAFRNAMSQFASGVTVVTTVDPEHGHPVGFTASAFSSLSLDPPLVLVCLDGKAESHATFRVATQMSISILAAGQTEIALRFAKRGADKFGGGGTSPGDFTGCALVDGALAQLECEIAERLPGGDHTILVGRVLSATIDVAAEPMLHYNRNFGRFAAES